MTDLDQARSAERGRVKKALRELESQQELRLSRIDAEMSRRGLQHSDARRQAIFEAQLERLNQSIVQRIAIRKEMVRNYPELGSVTELNRLTEVIQADVIDLQSECQKFSLIVPPEVFADLRARVQEGISLLKRETELQVRIKPRLPQFSLNIPHGGAERANVGPSSPAGSRRPVAGGAARPGYAAGDPATDPWATVCRKVDEAVGDLEERNAQLAGGLRHLADAIKETSRLAEGERTVYLEQVQFLAEQAARVATLRRVSVVKGILVALRAGLNEIPSVAPRLRAAGPLLESHFGITGTSY